MKKLEVRNSANGVLNNNTFAAILQGEWLQSNLGDKIEVYENGTKTYKAKIVYMEYLRFEDIDNIMSFFAEGIGVEIFKSAYQRQTEMTTKDLNKELMVFLIFKLIN